MADRKERKLIYTVLLLMSVACGAIFGVAAGLWTLVQVAVVIELMFWLGASGKQRSRSNDLSKAGEQS